MVPLAAALDRAVTAVQVCEVCGNVDTRSPCGICADPRRNSGLLIVVEDVADLWALERAGVGAVKYHVLGGVLSPLDGVGPDDLAIDSLIARAGEFSEIVLAVNATVEGQTTAHYLTDRLAPTGVKVTRLAHGVPVGGELDYLDEGTLAQALKARTDM
jgi:recombination protein RecR